MSLSSKAPLNFILDFDGTITTQDTLSTLGHLALSHQQEQQQQPTSDALSGQWSSLVSQYISDYNLYSQNNASASERQTLEQEIRFQRGLKAIEDRSFERVGRQGVFKGVAEQVLEVGGRKCVEAGQVRIRDGFGEFMKLLGRARWGVVSVNFSVPFIRGVLFGCGVKLDGDGDGKERVEILANRADPETGFLKGPLGDGEVVSSSADKLSVMRELVEGRWRVDLASTVYVGDSATDLECLLEAHVGVVVTDAEGESKLLERLRCLGLEVLHVGEYRPKDAKCLYWTRDFGEMVESGLLEGT